MPAAKVVYVDNDPVAVSHVRVLLTVGDEAAAVDADLAAPAAMTGHPAFRGIIDLAGPVCRIFGLVLNLFPARQARDIVSGYADLAAPAACSRSHVSGSTTPACGMSSPARSPSPTSTTTTGKRSPSSLPGSSSSTRDSWWPGPGGAGCPTRT